MVVAASSITLSPASFLRSAGTCFLPPRRLMSLRVPSFVGFQVSSLPPKQSSKLQVRAARTESSSVSLGPRAPYFELPEPLTGKVWKLDDFESNPAFLSQDVARAFGAVCTPEFFLYRKDEHRPFELFYHGQFDDSRPRSNIPVSGRDLSLAIDCSLNAHQLRSVQKSSVGCSIKWHPK